ncbi:MAG TPA: transcription termination/antitermination NusG family protein [Caulobacter sp.]|nr:transcription termination/antitermination NusG family protein [Caulobacter sp.]
MSDDAIRWYVVNTKAGREPQASANLVRQGYGVFLPVLRKTVRHARRQTEKLVAYFPGYLFVQLDLSRDRWRPIESTVGVLRMIKAQTAPLAAPSGLVEALQAQADGQGVVLPRDSELRPGQSVRIANGPFAERLATVDRMSGENRVRVLLAIMGQEMPVELDRQDIDA